MEGRPQTQAQHQGDMARSGRALPMDLPPPAILFLA